VEVLTALVTCAPLLGRAPLHPSLAVHAVALVENQVKVEVLPGAITDGFTLKLAVGITLTIVLALEVPPGPEQDSEYEVAADKEPVLCVPLTGRAPLQAPDAVQFVALLAVHDRVAVLPAATSGGEAVKVTTGTGSTETVAPAGEEIPPRPMQPRKYVAAEFKGPVLWVPLAARVPLQAPDAVHEVAPTELHESTAD
jgi:hypothetical protein